MMGNHDTTGIAHQARVAILLFAEALSAPECAWSLINAGWRVIALTRQARPPSIARDSRVAVERIPAPEEGIVASRARLQEFVRRFPGASILPLDDVALLLCRGLPNLAFGAPGEHPFALALHKPTQFNLAQDAGFMVPEWTLVDNPSMSIARPVASRWYVKPALACAEIEGRAVRGAPTECMSPAAVDRAVSSASPDNPMIVQAAVSGTGEGLFGLSTPAGVVAWSSHRRVRMMNPRGSGSSACRSQDPPRDAVDAAARFVSDARWTGLFMIELLRAADGQVIFMEFNGRPWGSMALARRRGLEYPAWTLELDATGCAPGVADTTRHMVCRHAGREVVHLALAVRDALTAGRVAQLGRSVVGLAGFRPSQRWYNSERFAVWVDDTIQTVRSHILR